MPPRQEKSHLKRGRPNPPNQQQDSKKPRRSERIANSQSKLGGIYMQLPPTNRGPTAPDAYKEATTTPPAGRPGPSQFRNQPPVLDAAHGFSSPPNDTQRDSQYSQYPRSAFTTGIVDEAKEGIWGYLLPLDHKFGDCLVLKKRDSLASPANAAHRNSSRRGKPNPSSQDHPGGYLIGRHPECDFQLEIPTISNRHCLIFNESRKDNSVAIVEDLSSNGTFINEAIVGRNKRRELEDGDEVTILDEARFVFRYPRSRATGEFRQKYKILQQLGKGHFATVFRCVEIATGDNYAVKRFEKPPGDTRHDSEGLQQEIAVLMGVTHPNVLCLKDTFDEGDAVFLVLELAPEGELFNWIVSHEKLSEHDTRKVFRQLFHGLKYLHERNIVHRDIKPENILLIDGRLNVKLADFGLAKIIGEDSFTTTLCGTPSYVAPEILENSRQRRYTRAVDVWSLGVVLYICLCGFPPFSDELYTAENPYNLADQIKMGAFNYPSPYWDSVGDPALDLIDRMLTVDPEQRITIDECLNHPWMTQKYPSVTDSTDGLTGAFGQLDFSRRKVERERTMLSSINDVRVGEVIEDEDQPGPSSQVKIFNKKTTGKRVHNPAGAGRSRHREPSPGENRDPAAFARVGGRGDPMLYDDEGRKGRRK